MMQVVDQYLFPSKRADTHIISGELEIQQQQDKVSFCVEACLQKCNEINKLALNYGFYPHLTLEPPGVAEYLKDPTGHFNISFDHINF